VIAHRLSTVREADKIVVLEQGKIVEVGSHDELLRHEGIYRRLHSLQETGELLS
jgi:ATP-binding cassette, subfamily B, bacterial